MGFEQLARAAVERRDAEYLASGSCEFDGVRELSHGGIVTLAL
jgi:hypothetical protein